jgi:hypothetical protein
MTSNCYYDSYTNAYYALVSGKWNRYSIGYHQRTEVLMPRGVALTVPEIQCLKLPFGDVVDE